MALSKRMARKMWRRTRAWCEKCRGKLASGAKNVTESNRVANATARVSDSHTPSGTVVVQSTIFSQCGIRMNFDFIFVRFSVLYFFFASLLTLNSPKPVKGFLTGCFRSLKDC